MIKETREELEKQKLTKELQKIDVELKLLETPWYRKPSVLVSVFSFIFAVSQFMSSEVKNYIADKKIELAEKNKVKNEIELSVLNAQKGNIELAKEQLYLDDENLQQNESVKKSGHLTDSSNIAPKKNDIKAINHTQENGIVKTRKIMDVWAFNVPESLVQKVRSYLKNQGNNVGYGGLILSARAPSWLSRQSTVMYYDKRAKSEANRIAKSLFEETNIKFEVRRGGGYGVKAGEEGKTFFIHLVGE